MGALYDVAADLVEMKLHGLCVDVRQGKRGASAARRANGAKQVGALVALIGGLTWSRTAPCPLPHQAVLWPIRASSWNQISIGVAAGTPAKCAFRVRGKFF